MTAWQAHVAAKRLKGAKHPHRDDWRIGLDHGESDSGAARLEISVAGASPFGKEQNCTTRQQPIENGLETCATSTLAINWHSLPASQRRAYARKAEKSIA